ncbi:hypothetical protein GCM10009779_06210 [Polymorphospora rubra]
MEGSFPVLTGGGFREMAGLVSGRPVLRGVEPRAVADAGRGVRLRRGRMRDPASGQLVSVVDPGAAVRAVR